MSESLREEIVIEEDDPADDDQATQADERAEIVLPRPDVARLTEVPVQLDMHGNVSRLRGLLNEGGEEAIEFWINTVHTNKVRTAEAVPGPWRDATYEEIDQICVALLSGDVPPDVEMLGDELMMLIAQFFAEQLVYYAAKAKSGVTQTPPPPPNQRRKRGIGSRG